MERILLLVDDEENILLSLARVFRKEGYQILKAASAKEGLALLDQHPVGVIVSDQRMPEMAGIEFLSEVKKKYPDTIRIMLSGYTDLKSVTDAINEGAIYKFLTKPWEDEMLRANVREAFNYHQLLSENNRLTQELKRANAQLSQINSELECRVNEKVKELTLNLHTLHVSQNIVESFPAGVLGIEDDGLIVLANASAHVFLQFKQGTLVGCEAADVLPTPLQNFYQASKTSTDLCYGHISLSDSQNIELYVRSLSSTQSSTSGAMVIMMPEVSKLKTVSCE